MQLGRGAIWFVFLVLCAAAFVLGSSRELPALVASHFGAAGAANGFMPRAFYVRFILSLVIGLPVVLAVLTTIALGRPDARINVPNRSYWLAPERRTQTVAFLRTRITWFAVLALAFLCYTHWLVVLANRSQPARLADSWFIGGLVSFFVALIALLTMLLGHFRKRT